MINVFSLCSTALCLIIHSKFCFLLIDVGKPCDRSLNTKWRKCSVLTAHQFLTKPLIGESLGLVSVSRLKVPRLSVSSRSRSKFWRLSRLGLVSDEKFSDSLVSVSSRLLQFYSVSSWSRPDLYV